MNRSRFVLTVLTACLPAALFAVSPAAQAQSFPTGRVTIIVPLGAGGPTDIAARALAPALEQRWKQPVTVENRTGGGTMIGGAAVARSAPDGHTLLFNGNGVLTGKLFLKEVPFDSAELRPITQMIWAPRIAVTNPAVPVKTLKEFIAYAKARPKELRYGTIAATSFDLDYVVFNNKAGIEMSPVPYPGGTTGPTALMRNDIQFFFAVVGAVTAQVNEGKLVALAVTSPERYPGLPSVPTAKEAGLDYEFTTSVGMWAPTKTPEAVFQQLATDLSAAMNTPAVAAATRSVGFEPSSMRPQQYAALMQAELKMYTEAAQQTGLKPQ
jgi:tripartite-type tricarboxylate transporter receptor subunit TctC